MKTLTIWGTGSGMSNALKRIDKIQYQVLALSDNDKTKWGRIYEGIKVLEPKEWVKVKADYIIIASRSYKEIITQLSNKYGMSLNNIYDSATFFQLIYCEAGHRAYLENNDLYKFYVNGKHNEMEKWFHYFDIYDTYFHRYRGKKITICEIGVFKGGSLKMWKNYFGPDVTVIGIDINPNCRQYEENGIIVEIGSQEDKQFWKYIKDKYPQIDILIDDGGHTMEQQILTFEEMFAHISSPGIYMCEDTHTSYWEKYDGGYLNRNTFIEYSKDIIDNINAWHSETEELNVNYYTNWIKGMHFYDSMVVVEKENRTFPFCLIK